MPGRGERVEATEQVGDLEADESPDDEVDGDEDDERLGRAERPRSGARRPLRAAAPSEAAPAPGCRSPRPTAARRRATRGQRRTGRRPGRSPRSTRNPSRSAIAAPEDRVGRGEQHREDQRERDRRAARPRPTGASQRRAARRGVVACAAGRRSDAPERAPASAASSDPRAHHRDDRRRPPRDRQAGERRERRAGERQRDERCPGPPGTGRPGSPRSPARTSALTGSHASSGSGARPRRRRTQPPTRSAATRSGDVDPERRAVEQDLGEQAEREGGEQDAARDGGAIGHRADLGGRAGRSGCTTPAVGARTTLAGRCVARSPDRGTRVSAMPLGGRRRPASHPGRGRPRRTTRCAPSVRPISPLAASSSPSCSPARIAASSVGSSRAPAGGELSGRRPARDGSGRERCAGRAPATVGQAGRRAAMPSAPRSTTPGSSGPGSIELQVRDVPRRGRVARDAIRAHRRLHRRVEDVQRRRPARRRDHLPHPGRSLGGRARRAARPERPDDQGRHRADRRGRGDRPDRRSRGADPEPPGQRDRRSRPSPPRATKISDVLEVQAQLTEVRGQIEQLTAQLTDLEDRAGFATLTATFRVALVAVEVAQQDWDPAAVVDEASASLVDVLQALATCRHLVRDRLAADPGSSLGVVAAGRDLGRSAGPRFSGRGDAAEPRPARADGALGRLSAAVDAVGDAPWHHALDDRPGRAIRPDRRGLRALVGARARDRPRRAPRPVRAPSIAAPAHATPRRGGRDRQAGARRARALAGDPRDRRSSLVARCSRRPTGAGGRRGCGRRTGAGFDDAVAFAAELPFDDATLRRGDVLVRPAARPEPGARAARGPPRPSAGRHASPT